MFHGQLSDLFYKEGDGLMSKFPKEKVVFAGITKLGDAPKLEVKPLEEIIFGVKEEAITN